MDLGELETTDELRLGLVHVAVPVKEILPEELFLEQVPKRRRYLIVEQGEPFTPLKAVPVIVHISVRKQDVIAGELSPREELV